MDGIMEVDGSVMEGVLQHIRLPLVSPSYLLTVVEPQSQRFISEAKERPYCNTPRPRRTTVIVTLGETKTLEGFDKVFSFDPLTNQWKALGRLPVDVNGYAVVTSGLVMLDGYVFAVGGWGVANSMERYDPNTNTWQIMHSVGVAAHYDSNSCDVVALVGQLYFIGGASMLFEVAKYNPKTSVWTEVAPMQIPRNKSAACVLNGKIYVTGGLYDDERTMENRMECYKPKTNQWTMCAPMQVKRFSPSMAVVDGLIYYVLGGKDFAVDDYDSSLRNIECYCEEKDTWETVGQISDAYCRVKCVSLKLRRDYSQPIDDDD